MEREKIEYRLVRPNMFDLTVETIIGKGAKGKAVKSAKNARKYNEDIFVYYMKDGKTYCMKFFIKK